MLRPLGSALPLGFFAFGMGMAVLTGIDVPLFSAGQVHAAAVLLLSFVAPLEILASVFAFLSRDGMAGTGLGLFAASWATIGIQDLLAKPATASPVLGLYLVAFTVVILLLGTVAIRAQPLLGIILLVSAARTVVAGVYEVGGPTTLLTAAGLMAAGIAVVAFYGALALLFEDTAGRTLLPLGRRGPARTSMEGALQAQVRRLEAEAGVRRTL